MRKTVLAVFALGLATALSTAIAEEVVTSVTTFFILFLALFALGGLLLALMGLDMVSAFSAR